MMTSSHLKGHLFERAVDALMLTLIASLALGLPLGDLYRDHGEITRMSILLQVGEEESADYISRVLDGDEPEIEVGIGLLSPKYRIAQERVVEIPDYVRKRFLASAVEPFVYRIPKVSVIEVELLVEGEPMQAHMFDLGMEPLHSDLIYKNLNFTLEDQPRFREAVEESARLHGGEVELTLRGRARTHYVFFKSWLQFSTTHYPIVSAPEAVYSSSRWVDLSGLPIHKAVAGQTIYIDLRVENPARIHTLHGNVTAIIYEVGTMEEVHRIEKMLMLAPGSSSNHYFAFTPPRPGAYTYELKGSDGEALLNESSASILVESG